MPEPVSISSGIAARYAVARFELAKEANEIDALEGDLDVLSGALSQSRDFASLIASPIYSRAQLAAAIDKISEEAGLTQNSRATLGLMAMKRRLFALPQFVAALRNLISEERGEVSAEVTAAKPLSEDQQETLAATLKSQFGKDVKINLAVDESLIGGLVVRVGSKMIDTSIKAKLSNMQNSMKEVG